MRRSSSEPGRTVRGRPPGRRGPAFGVVLGLAWGAVASTLAAPLVAQRLPFRNYTSDDGLAQSVVLAMTQDADGYLWLGTPAGLSRFDGLVFTNFGEADGLLDSTVRALFETPDGALWIGTDRGLARRRDGRFDAPGAELGLPEASIRALVDDGQGGLWVGTYGEGAFHVASAGTRRYTTADGLGHDRVRTAAREPGGRVWLGTYGGGVSRVETDGHLTSFGPARGLADPYVRGIAFGSQGEVAVATNSGVFVLPPGGDAFEPFLPTEPALRKASTALLFDRRDRLWVGTRDEGLCRWDGTRTECWRTSEGLADDSIDDLLLDREGNVWVGTFSGGVSRLSNEGFLNYTVGDGLPAASVVAFTQDREGTLWMGTHGGGLARLEGGRLVPGWKGALPHAKVVSAMDDGTGELWFGSLGGAFAIEGDRIRRVGFAEGLADETVLDVARDGEGTLWIATARGILAFRADGSRFSLGTAEGLPAERVNMVLPARSGGVWIATSGGLARWADGRLIATYGAADGLSDAYVIAVLEARDGTLWLGTGGGLARLQPDGRFASYGPADGLPHLNTTALLEDDQGRLWIGTTGGIAVFDGGRFTVFRSSDGLVSGEVNPHAAFRDQAGRLWFGTVQGAIAFKPSAVAPAGVEPPIHVTRVVVDGEDVAWGTPLVLDHRQNDLRFEFVGISLAHPDDVHYEHRLEGLDTRTRSGKSRFADFPALPPGRYAFSVRAVGRGGVASTESASVAFTIRPPFWLTAWFRLLVAGLLVAVVLAVHRLKVKTIEERNEQLVEMVAERTRAESEIRRYAQELEHTSLHDSLTDLPNRALLRDRLEVAVAQAERHPERGFAVLFLDLDRFKLVNDSHGHAVGDQLLVECAARLRGSLRPSDTVARLGGDELAVLLADVGDAVEATRLAERIQRALSGPYRLAGHEMEVTASIGIALGRGGVAVDDLLRDADTAMYRAKARGRGQCAVFDPVMHARAVEQLQLETDLRRALQRQELRLHYQPIRCLHTGEISACEALLRWAHPERGLLGPAAFLAQAEETGLGLPIGDWVVREAARQAAAWGEQRAVPVSINLFNRQVIQRDLASRLRRILDEAGSSPALLHLEITEDVLIEEPETAVAILSEVRAMDVRILLDDFGTGYSSLSYLQRFPVDMLKIDRSFIGRLDARDDSRKIVETILHLARSLGIEVVAEGVETEAQLRRLESLGCDYAQGYFISPPRPPQEIEPLLAAAPAAVSRI